MLRGVSEVFVCREQRQVVPNGELCKYCINGADLNTRLAACISQSGSANVVISIWLKQRQGSEPLNDLSLRFGS